MHKSQHAANPFALMTNPAAVLDALAHSDRLGGLESRVCRPLDRPLVPMPGDVAEFDRAVDAGEIED
jgi:hypothetical protein